MDELVYVIPAKSSKEFIIDTLSNHPEIQFVSLVGIDLAGNDTDEKIPIKLFIDDIDSFYDGSAVQTDGSSVVLTGIATLNNGKVDIPIDPNVNWFVDYNWENYDEETDLPIGTLRIPSFLVHEGKRVGSRSVLTDTLEYVRKEILATVHENPHISGLEHIDGRDIIDIVFTAATELEFWVKTPLSDAMIEEMHASQVMQEQYWQRTHGIVRTALERAVSMMNKYGLEVEMGHKEVGGIKAHLDENGHMISVCEQIEIDWKYSTVVQTADNELLARIIIREVFRMAGLEVSFKAKPMIGLAGNGEHTHVGIAAITKDGKFYNLFAPHKLDKDFLSALGYGAIMGMLKNYEVINPFVSATNDSMNRLKPGFEAPICIVTSLGNSPDMPSRNRTILIGVIRDLNNPKATRFEVRSCNPYTNTYLALSAIYSAALDGIKYACAKTTDELLKELSKEAGQEAEYLEKERAYRSEKDIFDDYSQTERDSLFGAPPATVWENMAALDKYPDKLAVLTAGKALNESIISAYKMGALHRWKYEIISRIVPENREFVRKAKKRHDDASGMLQDDENWSRVNNLRLYLAKDSIHNKSLFTRLVEALQKGDFETASLLQVEMYDCMELLKELYAIYDRNII